MNVSASPSSFSSVRQSHVGNTRRERTGRRAVLQQPGIHASSAYILYIFPFFFSPVPASKNVAPSENKQIEAVVGACRPGYVGGRAVPPHERKHIPCRCAVPFRPVGMRVAVLEGGGGLH